MLIDDVRHGALNMYSTDADAFGADEIRTGRSFAAQAGVVIASGGDMSGGTMLALAADEILMDDNAVLGPVDPRIGQWPAASILKVAEAKPIERVNDETLILADIARKAQVQVKEFVMNVLLDDFPEERADSIADELTSGRWTHDYPLTFEALAAIGLPVSSELNLEVFELMDLYPQVGRQRPSVQYVPIPYRAPLPTSPTAPRERD